MMKKLLRSATLLWRDAHQLTSFSVVGPVMGAEN